MNDRLRVGLVLAAVTAVCLPIYRGGYKPGLLLPLARANAIATAGVLDLLGVPVVRDNTILRYSPTFAIDVGVHCTAWIYLALWVAGAGANEGTTGRNMFAIICGLAWLGVVNIGRLVMIFVIGSSFTSDFEAIHSVAGEVVLLGAWLAAWKYRAMCERQEAQEQLACELTVRCASPRTTLSQVDKTKGEES